jgi:hypothetical protein
MRRQVLPWKGQRALVDRIDSKQPLKTNYVNHPTSIAARLFLQVCITAARHTLSSAKYDDFISSTSPSHMEYYHHAQRCIKYPSRFAQNWSIIRRLIRDRKDSACISN